jgi:hypothetical protein
MRELAAGAEQAYVLANTNARSPDPRGGELAQGPANALALARVLGAAGLAVTPSGSG